MGKSEMNKVSWWSSWVGFQEIWAPPLLLSFPGAQHPWHCFYEGFFSPLQCANSQKLSAWFIGTELHGFTLLLCIINPQCKTWEEIIHSVDEQNDFGAFFCLLPKLKNATFCFFPPNCSHWFSVTVVSLWMCRWGQRGSSMQGTVYFHSIYSSKGAGGRQFRKPWCKENICLYEESNSTSHKWTECIINNI